MTKFTPYSKGMVSIKHGSETKCTRVKHSIIPPASKLYWNLGFKKKIREILQILTSNPEISLRTAHYEYHILKLPILRYIEVP